MSAPRTTSVSRDTPFRILLLGDFGGEAVPLSQRRPRLIDADNRADVMSRLGVAVTLSAEVAGESALLRLSSLDSLHPDSLVHQLPVFERFRRLRAELVDASSFDRAAEEVRGWASWTGTQTSASGDTDPTSPPTGHGAETHSRQAPVPLPEDLLEQTLEATQAGAEEPDASYDSTWLEAIRDVVRPYAVPGKPPRQDELLDCVDHATTLSMNRVLHSPRFQMLEANWRSVDFLIRRLPLGTPLKLYLCNVPKSELEADFAANEDLTRTALFRWLAEESEQTSGGLPWAVVAGLYEFGPTPEDARLLAKAGGIARYANTPFLAGASPALLGCRRATDMSDPRHWDMPIEPEMRAVWDELRRWPEADFVGLAVPRLMLRLPYGSETSPIETFAFEEMPSRPVHDDYLWGSAAVPCVFSLADSFSRVGWQLRSTSRFEIADLPLHVFDQDGESLVYPPSEVFVTERAVDAAAKLGLNCLVSVRQRDAVQISGLRSFAGNPLPGPWSSAGH